MPVLFKKPTPSQINLIKNAKNHFYYWKNSKIPKVPSSGRLCVLSNSRQLAPRAYSCLINDPRWGLQARDNASQTACQLDLTNEWDFCDTQRFRRLNKAFRILGGAFSLKGWKGTPEIFTHLIFKVILYVRKRAKAFIKICIDVNPRMQIV